MVDLGVNGHHQAQLLSYMKFAQYLRGQSLKSVEHAFADATTSLFDDTYTKDEVKTILDNLMGILSCDMEGEMCSFAHNNMLMLQQLFKQAEHWHLRLEVQLSELQNRELLEVIQMLESDETLVKAPVEKHTEESSIALLRMEIERLRTENQRLQDQQQECADKLEQTEGDLSAVNKNLLQAAVELQSYRTTMSQPSASETVPDDSKVAEMEQKLQQVELLLQTDQESSRMRQSALMLELNSTREQVAQVQAQLQLAELELERKFSETKAYANMKQILMKKNGQIRRLRDRLQEVAGDEEGAGDEDEL